MNKDLFSWLSRQPNLWVLAGGEHTQFDVSSLPHKMKNGRLSTAGVKTKVILKSGRRGSLSSFQKRSSPVTLKHGGWTAVVGDRVDPAKSEAVTYIYI